MEDKKEIFVLIESLKLYVAISTISIGGLLTFYSKGNATTYLGLFYFSLVFLFLAAIISIGNINHFVSGLYHNTADVSSILSRTLNTLAIGSFILGISMGGAFIYFNRVHNEVPININVGAGVVIEGQSIKIGNDVKTKIEIGRDSLNRITVISIN